MSRFPIISIRTQFSPSQPMKWWSWRTLRCSGERSLGSKISFIMTTACASITWCRSWATCPSAIFLEAKSLVSPSWRGSWRCTAEDFRWTDNKNGWFWKAHVAGPRTTDKGDRKGRLGSDRTFRSWRRRSSNSHVHGEPSLSLLKAKTEFSFSYQVMRGVQKINSKTVTSSMLGNFR